MILALPCQKNTFFEKPNQPWFEKGEKNNRTRGRMRDNGYTYSQQNWKTPDRHKGANRGKTQPGKKEKKQDSLIQERPPKKRGEGEEENLLIRL
jgi:hypothetical protein